MDQNKWDSHWLSVADKVAEMSKDPSTKVGAILLDERNVVVATGYNGGARGTDDHTTVNADRERKILRTIHAETNALIFADRKGHTLYVTFPPCAQCMAHAIQHGVKRVVFRYKDYSKWKESHLEAIKMATEAGVETCGRLE